MARLRGDITLNVTWSVRVICFFSIASTKVETRRAQEFAVFFVCRGGRQCSAKSSASALITEAEAAYSFLPRRLLPLLGRGR